MPFVESKIPSMRWPLHWCGLAEEALDDALCDSKSRRAFLGIEFSRESVLDTLTLHIVRQRLQEGDLALVPPDENCDYFVAPVFPVRASTIVTADITNAPRFDQDGGWGARAREPPHWNGIKWRLGMMSRIGGDASSGQITAASQRRR